MFNKTRNIFVHKLDAAFSNLKFNLQVKRSIGSLKVEWRKDPKLDLAIEKDKRYKLCARVVREVLNEPGQVIPLRYLEKRRERMRLNVHITTFLNQNPGLFDVYFGRIKPKTDPVRFLRASNGLRNFLEEEKRIYRENEPLLVSKLCKLLLMSKDKVISADKLLNVKREFGFPNDFMVNLIPKYPQYFRLKGCPGEGQSFLELLSWEPEFAKSVIEQRAEEETKLTGIRVRPNFSVKLPSGFFLKREMREWTRDWIELDYISPYEDVSKLDQASGKKEKKLDQASGKKVSTLDQASGKEEKKLDPASREMEKRTIGVFHELLSLTLYKRIPVPILGKFCDEYMFPNAFSSAFTRHPGIFYLSLKGGIKTAVLREAYKNDELIDRDPLLEIKDKFVELLEDGWGQRAEELRLRGEQIKKDMETSAVKAGE